MSHTEVSDIAHLIETLGGLAAASRIFGETPQTVGNWRYRDRIPARLYMEHSKILRQHKVSAPVSFWAFKRSSSEAAA